MCNNPYLFVNGMHNQYSINEYQSKSFKEASNRLMSVAKQCVEVCTKSLNHIYLIWNNYTKWLKVTQCT